MSLDGRSLAYFPKWGLLHLFRNSVGMDGPFLLIVAAMLTLSRGVQPCTHANSTLCSMRYWLAPLVTGPFLAFSACYWPVPGLFRLLLTCSLLVPLVTGSFRLFRVLVTSVGFYVLIPAQKVINAIPD